MVAPTLLLPAIAAAAAELPAAGAAEPAAGTAIVHPTDGAVMVYVPGGEFIMGLDPVEAATVAGHRLQERRRALGLGLLPAAKGSLGRLLHRPARNHGRALEEVRAGHRPPQQTRGNHSAFQRSHGGESAGWR